MALIVNGFSKSPVSLLAITSPRHLVVGLVLLFGFHYPGRLPIQSVQVLFREFLCYFPDEPYPGRGSGGLTWTRSSFFFGSFEQSFVKDSASDFRPVVRHQPDPRGRYPKSVQDKPIVLEFLRTLPLLGIRLPTSELRSPASLDSVTLCEHRILPPSSNGG